MYNSIQNLHEKLCSNSFPSSIHTWISIAPISYVNKKIFSSGAKVFMTVLAATCLKGSFLVFFFLFYSFVAFTHKTQ